nr:DNA ligase 1-like [Onthophagus taurus]
MPIDRSKDSSPINNDSSSSTTRTKGRPPWVKETPNPLPTPTMPWTLNKRNSLKENAEESSKLVVPKLRKVVKSDQQENGNGKKETTTFQKPQLKPVPPKETTLQSKEVKIPIPKLNSVKDRELAPLKRNSVAGEDYLPDNIDKAVPATRNALVRQESMKKFGVPNAPPLPPPAPALPDLSEATNLSNKQKEKLDMLRQRPKHRPDWTQMLKDLEKGARLKHVECNDRSKPLLPKVKSKGQFIFESENHQKNDPHHDLLKQIEQGVKLKKVKTNDRSKPILDGLRKFRRQMTIEEQIIKSQSMASIPPEDVPDESDEMDDIDKVRDDLQSTKQLLAFEMRNKEAQIRENKKLLAKIQQLEAELEKHETRNEGGGVINSSTNSEADQKLITSLKQEAQEARKTSEELEKKYSQATEELDTKKTELEEAKKQNRELERKLQEYLTGKRQSIPQINNDQEEEEIYEVSESESEGSDNEEKRERRAQREVKMFRNKLRSCKNKRDNAKKERVALKEQVKTHQKCIKEEKKKYKALQKEVDKMAKLMKESSEDEDEDDSDQDEDEESKEESASESEESESSESESSEESETDSEASHSEPEDAPTDKVKNNLSHRVKRHENMLAALKKGNLMLKANVERLQDDLNKQKDLTMALQEDLDSVLAELG